MRSLKTILALTLAVSCALGLTALAPSANAATTYRYFTDAGGPLTWNATNANWGAASGGPYNTTWSSGAVARFEGTPGTVHVDGTLNVRQIAFYNGATGYTLDTSTGGTLNTVSDGTIDTGAGTDTISCNLSSSTVGIYKVGTGTVYLSGNNSFNGSYGVCPGVGTLSVSTISDTDGASNIGGAGSALYFYTGTATFQYTGAASVETTRILDISSHTTVQDHFFDITDAGAALTFSPTGGQILGTIDKLGAGTMVLNAPVHNKTSPSLIKTAVGAYGGTLKLTGINDYTGITDVENAGSILSVEKIADSGDSNIGYGGDLYVTQGGTLKYTGTGAQSTARRLRNGVTGGAIFNITEATGSLTFSTASNDAFFTKDLTKTGAGALSINRVISSTAAVAINQGTLTLGGANTYDGGTTVTGGTLWVNNTSGSGTGSGAVSLDALSTLGGSGSISGLVTDSGKVAPGNSAGKLTLAGGLTSSGGTYDWELGSLLDNSTGTAGTNWDLIDLATTGALSLTDPTIHIAGLTPGSDAFWQSTHSWTIISQAASASLSGTVSITGYDLARGSFGIAPSGNDVLLSWTPVPEPSALALLSSGFLGLLAYAWRKRK